MLNPHYSTANSLWDLRPSMIEALNGEGPQAGWLAWNQLTSRFGFSNDISPDDLDQLSHYTPWVPVCRVTLDDLETLTDGAVANQVQANILQAIAQSFPVYDRLALRHYLTV